MIQNYILARSLQQAYELNQERGSRILGGGLWLRLGEPRITTAIDLSALGLNTIEETEDRFHIGAMVTLRGLETHARFGAYTRGAAEKALRPIVGVQFRNLATVGGSVFGRFGFSDVLTLFLALDTRVELFPGGTVPLEQFVQAPANREVLVRLTVEKTPGIFFYGSMRPARTDFPILTCALSRIGGEYRAVYGARPGRAVVLRDEEGILSGGITPGSARAFGEYAAAHVTTGSNSRGSADYRSRLVDILTRRGLLELEGQCYGD